MLSGLYTWVVRETMNDLNDNPLNAITEFTGTLRFTKTLTYDLFLYSLRRTGASVLESELGVTIPGSSPVSVEIGLSGVFQMERTTKKGCSRLRVTANSTRPAEFSVAVLAGENLRIPVIPQLRGAAAVEGGITRETPAAIRHKILAQLAAICALPDPLLEIDLPENGGELGPVCKFDDGDFRSLDAQPGSLPHRLMNHLVIELHLPFFNRKEWKLAAEALQNATVQATEGGQIAVFLNGNPQDACDYYLTLAAKSYTVGSTAAFEMVHTLRAPGASFTFQIPGEALKSWLLAPSEHSPQYAPVYRQVSRTVQEVMRHWLPQVWFNDPAHYADTAASYAMLAYGNSQPCAGRTRTTLSFDLLGVDSLSRFYATAERGYGTKLAEIGEMLHKQGRTELAAFYSRKRTKKVLISLRRSSKMVKSLLFAETQMTNVLISLGVDGGFIGRTLTADPAQAARVLSAFAGEYTESAYVRMRRIHSTADFSMLNPMILMEASAALSRALGRELFVERKLETEGQQGACGLTCNLPANFPLYRYSHSEEIK